jgi:hypothetical protein
MNTVAQPPQSDGKQPAGEASSSKLISLAAPIPAATVSAVAPSNPKTGDEHAKSASVPEYDSDLTRRRQRAQCGAEHQPFPDSATHNPLAESDADEISAPIRTTQASSSQAAGQLALNAGDCVPPSLFDPAFLAAWRETQGQPIDAEPRTS